MTSFTPISSTLGGMIIGLAALGLLMFHGRIAGISGIAGGLLRAEPSDRSWRVWFLLGLVFAGMGWGLLQPEAYRFEIERSNAALVVAGLLVGFGTQLGSGCTSGHGVCGIGRLSRRSIAATLTFMGSAALTVFLIRLLFGGSI